MKHNTDNPLSRLSLMTFPMAPDLGNGCLSPEDTIEIAAESGIPYVDLLDVEKSQAERYVKALRQTGIRVLCYIASISPFEEDTLLNEQIRSGLETASCLGASMFMLVPYRGSESFLTAQQLEPSRVRERIRAYYRLAVKLAEPYPIKVCLETTPHEVLRLSGSDDLVWILQNVPGLGLVFDTANMFPHGEQTMEAYRRLKDYIIHVHLKDVRLIASTSSYPGLERVPDGRSLQGVVLGQGIVPVSELYEAMRKDGYQGCFALEYVRPAETPCNKKAHLEQVQRFLQFFENGGEAL